MRNVICVTLLIATNFLMSDCIIVDQLAINESNSHKICLPWTRTTLLTRKAPYLPNFNRTLAKIIEPLVLASTWAFGSQKCNPSTGIFTRNGKKTSALISLLKHHITSSFHSNLVSITISR